MTDQTQTPEEQMREIANAFAIDIHEAEEVIQYIQPLADRCALAEQRLAAAEKVIEWARTALVYTDVMWENELRTSIRDFDRQREGEGK